MNKAMIMVFGASLLLVSAAAAAETYRWVDANGKVHYSDRPVQGAQQVEVKVPGDSAGTPAEATAETKETVTPESDQSPPVDGSELNDIVRAEQCRKAQERLSSYENADDIYQEDATGKRRVLSADDRVSAIISARKSVSSLCSTPNS